MVSVFCHECGNFIEEVNDDELPLTFDCEACGHTFVEEPDLDWDEDSYEEYTEDADEL